MYSRHKQLSGGQAMMIVVVIFLVLMLAVVMGVATSVLSDLGIARALGDSVQSYAAAESLIEDALYRLNNGYAIADPETLTVGGFTVDAEVNSVPGGLTIVSEGNVDEHIRRVAVNLILGTGASFNFGVQTDVGGIVMENNSIVNGNVFSNGLVQGKNSNLVDGDAVSAGASGLLDGIHATGDAYSHTINNSTVDGNAYYQVISSSTVAGDEFPESEDQGEHPLPISDEQIDEWKTEAEAGGVATCSEGSYSINDDTTIGPIKIPCDLDISGNNFTVDLAGPVWVEGTVTITNSPTIRVDSSLGASSVAFMADNESNRTSSSRIDISNGATFANSGTDGSYVFFVSMNESAELGGSTTAIVLQNSVNGDVLLYAPHGEILLKNSVDLREVTAWRVRLQNYSAVTYETGLASLLFTSGPGGSYEVSSWEEVE